jgi:hypothetical protein
MTAVPRHAFLDAMERVPATVDGAPERKGAMLVNGRRAAIVAWLALVAIAGCGAPAGPTGPPGTSDAGGLPGTSDAGGPPTAEPPSAGPVVGRGASVSVRGKTYLFPEGAATTCIVGPGRVSVNTFTTDPRLVLTINWRASGTSHVNFGEPVGGLGAWQAGDDIGGATDVAFRVDGRTAEFRGPMRHTDASIDEATIQVSC